MDGRTGHYTTYRRVEEEEKGGGNDDEAKQAKVVHRWIYADDEKVRWAEESEVLEAEAYMLFYKSSQQR